jgi:hypothetical protein
MTQSINQNPLLSRISKTASEYEDDTRRLLGMGTAKPQPVQPEKTASFEPDLLKLKDSELLAKMAAVDPLLAAVIPICSDFGTLDADCKVAARMGDPELIAVTNANMRAFLASPVEGLKTAANDTTMTPPGGATTAPTKGDLLGSFMNTAAPEPPGQPDTNMRTAPKPTPVA